MTDDELREELSRRFDEMAEALGKAGLSLRGVRPGLDDPRILALAVSNWAPVASMGARFVQLVAGYEQLVGSRELVERAPATASGPETPEARLVLLQAEMEVARKAEDYERCSKILDEINHLKENA